MSKEEKMKIKLYRHKVHKNLYLKRNWHIMGSPEAEWWSATDKLYEALQSYRKYENHRYIEVDIEEEYKRFENNDCFPRYRTKYTFEKEMEFDGYKGKLEKEEIMPLSDYELVVLEELD